MALLICQNFPTQNLFGNFHRVKGERGLRGLIPPSPTKKRWWEKSSFCTHCDDGDDDDACNLQPASPFLTFNIFYFIFFLSFYHFTSFLCLSLHFSFLFLLLLNQWPVPSSSSCLHLVLSCNYICKLLLLTATCNET